MSPFTTTVPGRACPARRVPRSLAALGGALLAFLAGVARGDEVDDLNAVYRQIAPALRSDAVLLPLLAKMQPAPKAVGTLDQAMLLPAGGQGWDGAAAWAQGAPQQAVLEALKRVTAEQDWHKSFAFGQPYGISPGDPTPELVQARLYTELGDPPLLAAARYMYMPALDAMAVLVNVEATRLTAEKKAPEAATLLTNWVFFCRQMADRQMFREVKWGMQNMASGLERLRDVLYTDYMSGQPSVSPGDVQALLGRLQETDPTKSYFDLDRIRFPVGDKKAADQIIARVYQARGGVDERTFATTMAKLGATERPLRLFAEAGRWQQVGGQQASQPMASAEAERVYNDWATRWTLDPFDRHMGDPLEYGRMDKSRYAVIDAVLPDMGELFRLRQVCRVEAVGTRTAMAVLAYTLRNKQFPPVVTAVRPQWVAQLEADPFNPNRGAGAKPPLKYFLPMREETNTPADLRKPYEITIVPPGGGQAFVAKADDKTFVLYSWGSDLAEQRARRVQNTAEVVQGADYLVWPPVVSLRRQYMRDLGQLK